MRNALTLQSFYEKSMRKGLVIAIAVGILLGSCKDKKMENVFAIEDDVVEDSLEAYVGDTLHLFEDVEPPAAVRVSRWGLEDLRRRRYRVRGHGGHKLSSGNAGSPCLRPCS